MIKQQKIQNELKTSPKKKEMLIKEYKKIDRTIHTRFKNVVKYLEETYISVIKREFEQMHPRRCRRHAPDKLDRMEGPRRKAGHRGCNRTVGQPRVPF